MSEDAGDSRFLLFCKDDPTRPTEYRWCGVVVEQRLVEQNGEVLDAILQPTEEALLLWFDGWQSGRKSAEFDNARKDERPMTVDEGVRVLVDEVLRLRSEAVNADLLAALRQLESASTSVGQHLVYNAPTREFSSAIQAARAAIARADPPGTEGKDAA
jgi:hypothetical protein